MVQNSVSFFTFVSLKLFIFSISFIYAQSDLIYSVSSYIIQTHLILGAELAEWREGRCSMLFLENRIKVAEFCKKNCNYGLNSHLKCSFKSILEKKHHDVSPKYFNAGSFFSMSDMKLWSKCFYSKKPLLPPKKFWLRTCYFCSVTFYIYSYTLLSFSLLFCIQSHIPCGRISCRKYYHATDLEIIKLNIENAKYKTRKIDRSNHPEVFCKKGVLKNFSNTWGLKLYQKIDSLTDAFPWILRNF